MNSSNSFFNKHKASQDVAKQRKEIEDYLVDANMNNDIKLREAHHRNIIFLGKTRSGKSTVFNVLRKLTYITGHTSIFSETQEPKLYSFTVSLTQTLDDGEQKEVNYNINIVDTPGLFEQKMDKNDVRTNNILKKTIYKCLEYEITKIHAIFLVCSFETGINEQDIYSMKEFLELFSGAEESICLLITRAETYSEDIKEKMVKEILQHPHLKDIVNMIKTKIFFTGSIKLADYEAGSVGSVKRDCENVYEMRSKIYHYIFNKDNCCQISNLEFYKVKQAETRTLMENILKVQAKQSPGNITDEYEKIIKELEKMKAFISSETREESIYGDIMTAHRNLHAAGTADK